MKQIKILQKKAFKEATPKPVQEVVREPVQEVVREPVQEVVREPVLPLKEPTPASVEKKVNTLKPGYISKNFTWNELERSQTAARRRINNSPTEAVKRNATEAVRKLFQPLRDMAEVPFNITSWYRSPALNKAVGGSTNSSHMSGSTIDVNIPGLGTTKQQAEKLIRMMKDNNLAWDQIILEFYNPKDPHSGWVHLSYKSNSGAQRKQILTAVRRNSKTVYLNGLH